MPTHKCNNEITTYIVRTLHNLSFLGWGQVNVPHIETLFDTTNYYHKNKKKLQFGKSRKAILS